MRRSTSKSSTPERAPSARPLSAGGGAALSVDVEEWYHNCWAPEYVDPARRGRQPEALDRQLPELLERLARHRARATFFVLGEVARRLPARVREIVAAGHEVACHGDLHQRANELAPEPFRRQLMAGRDALEQVIGREVLGYRAPEWSLRSLANPRLRVVAELGFAYDSSLVPSPGAGGAGNPTRPSRLVWSDGVELIELPPLVWGGGLRLPAGGWCGRLAPPAWLLAAAAREAAAGGLPLFVVHPWELDPRPCPGLLTGFARFFHEAARGGYPDRFDQLLDGLAATRTLAEWCGTGAAEPAAGSPLDETAVEMTAVAR